MDIPPDAAHLVAGRALRTRTVAQLKPYSVEQLKYTKTLLKNGWEGAVVRTKRPVEETAEELQRKKEELARKPKDSLGGWLVSDEENGTGDSLPRLQDRSLGSADTSSGLQSDEDGMSLLEREARRKERMELAVAAAMGGNGKKRRKFCLMPARSVAPLISDRSLSLLASPTQSLSHRQPSSPHEGASIAQEAPWGCRIRRRFQRLVNRHNHLSSTKASSTSTRRKCTTFFFACPLASKNGRYQATTSYRPPSFRLGHRSVSPTSFFRTTADSGG